MDDEKVEIQEYEFDNSTAEKQLEILGKILGWVRFFGIMLILGFIFAACSTLLVPAYY